MIPTNRPVLWQDVEDLRIRFGLGHNLICQYLGMINEKWKIIRKDPELLNKMVEEPSVAILARMYDTAPEIAPDTYKPDMRQVYHDLCEDKRIYTGDPNATIKLRHFSIDFGRNSSAGYAWTENGTPPRSVVGAMVDCLYRDNGRANKVFNRYGLIHEIALIEAEARGVMPYITGEWRTPKGK